MTTFVAISNEERVNRALRRSRAVYTRPSTLAAHDFLQSTANLPERLAKLVNVLNQWDVPNDHEQLSCSLSSDPAESRRIALTAAITVRATPTLQKEFQTLLQDSLSNGKTEEWFASLHQLKWVESLLHPVLCQVLQNTMMSQCHKTIRGEFEEEDMLGSMQSWKEEHVVPWVCSLVGEKDFQDKKWECRLSSAMLECFALVRMEEIFDIVADYPDSNTAVQELSGVLQATKMHSLLSESLETSLTKRLCHPGANTSQIIDVYINTIKVLREIDPSDRLLEVVAEPVRSYLRGRQDTVRCIITSLTDEETGGDLYDELRRQDAKPLEDVYLDSDDEDEQPDMNWQPDPPLSKQRGTFFSAVGSSSSTLDILSMLVSIYGSKELFVDEYRIMLADKLLSNLDFNTDKEVHTLELLKLRFGEASMRQCEIMIKDLDESKRIISNIHSTIQDKHGKDRKPTYDAAIISHIFWPSIQREQLSHHPQIQAELDKFGDEYGRLKNPRRLAWYKQLGTVQLELEVVETGVGGEPVMETKQFSCSPVLASLIRFFEDKDNWTSEELSNAMGIPEHAIQKRMTFWINNHVVQPISVGFYQLATIEHWRGREGHHHSVHEEDHSVSIGVDDEAEMALFESYIVGMLKRLKELPLERIHSMLKMFANSGSDHAYNKTPRQLGAFLQKLCREGKLECGPDGMFKLVEK